MGRGGGGRYYSSEFIYFTWKTQQQEYLQWCYRYEADVIKSITAEVRTPEEVFDYPYYDEVGLFSLAGDGYESSDPFKLPTLAVVILVVGVTGGICRVLWRHKRYSILHSMSWLIVY